jgi:hypothetical protein
MPRKATKLRLVGLAEAAELVGVPRSTLSQRLHSAREPERGAELPSLLRCLVPWSRNALLLIVSKNHTVTTPGWH